MHGWIVAFTTGAAEPTAPENKRRRVGVIVKVVR